MADRGRDVHANENGRERGCANAVSFHAAVERGHSSHACVGTPMTTRHRSPERRSAAWPQLGGTQTSLKLH